MLIMLDKDSLLADTAWGFRIQFHCFSSDHICLFFLRTFLLLFSVYVLPACMLLYYMYAVPTEIRRRHQIFQKWELQRAVSCHMVVGNWTQIHRKSSRVSWSTEPSMYPRTVFSNCIRYVFVVLGNLKSTFFLMFYSLKKYFNWNGVTLLSFHSFRPPPPRDLTLLCHPIKWIAHILLVIIVTHTHAHAHVHVHACTNT